MTRPPGELVARAIATAIPLAAAAFAIANPQSVLYGGTAWLVVLVASLAGLGHLVERIVRCEVDLGLRLVWGIAAYLVVAGVGYALGVLSFPVLVGVIVVGIAGFVVRQWTAPRPSLYAVADLARSARAAPSVAAYFALIAAVAGIDVIAGVADTQGNTFDDDVIYTPLIKRTLDVGDIDEPASFRRLAAFGGQTALGALGAVRGTLDNVNLADGALCQLAVFLLVVGLARRRPTPDDAASSARAGPADQLVLGLVLLDLVLLPSGAINSGSYWSGVMIFIALYRTLALALTTARPDHRLYALTGVVAAAACTLRMNYVPIAVLTPAIGLALARANRRQWLATAAGGAAALIPWCIASYRSGHTFLYPFWTGTFNPEIATTPATITSWQELQLWLKVLIEPDPIRVILMLVPVMAVVRDGRRGRPLIAYAIAAWIGLGILIHTFTVADAPTLWRYAFGYMTALFILFVVEAGAAGLRPDSDGDGPVRTPLLARFVVIACLVIQVGISPRGVAKRYATIASDLQYAASTHARPQGRIETPTAYAELQRSVPAGSTLAIALDEPFYLDYARNPIMNLDTPGFAGPAPGFPSFRGPDAVADYFRGEHIRYLAFVRGSASRYQFRREFWLRRMLFDSEWWRVQGAYTVDAVDNFEALATSHRVLFERDGMVVVDLQERR